MADCAHRQNGSAGTPRGARPDQRYRQARHSGGHEIIRSGQADETRQFRRRASMGRQITPVQRQQGADVRARRMTHEIDPVRITPQRRRMAQGPVHRCRPILDEDRKAHQRIQPVVRHNHHRAQSRQATRQQPILAATALFPATAVEKHDHWQPASGCRPVDVQQLPGMRPESCRSHPPRTDQGGQAGEGLAPSSPLARRFRGVRGSVHASGVQPLERGRY